MTWGGAQWVLATLLVISLVVPPLLRLALIDLVRKPAKTWSEFWLDWAGRSLNHAGLVAILYWGGFWG